MSLLSTTSHPFKLDAANGNADNFHFLMAKSIKWRILRAGKALGKRR